VAIVDDAPVGMASIVEHDMQTRMELTPWLAAVYVVPAFRNQGIGSLLVREAMQEAAELGVSRLFLFTPDRMNFYHRLGWREQEVVSYRGEQVTIMSYDIPANT
jgi:GNAT superfamily N-acetyltransferase